MCSTHMRVLTVRIYMCGNASCVLCLRMRGCTCICAGYCDRDMRSEEEGESHRTRQIGGTRSSIHVLDLPSRYSHKCRHGRVCMVTDGTEQQHTCTRINMHVSICICTDRGGCDNETLVRSRAEGMSCVDDSGDSGDDGGDSRCGSGDDEGEEDSRSASETES